jgi:glucose 1-dehydrogenase
MTSDGNNWAKTGSNRFSPDLLRGQKALVTGASSGIGKAIAIALAEAGAQVAVNFRGPAESAKEVVSTIEGTGGRAIAVPADVSREEQVLSMFSRALEEFGTVDILVSHPGKRLRLTPGS